MAAGAGNVVQLFPNQMLPHARSAPQAVINAAPVVVNPAAQARIVEHSGMTKLGVAGAVAETGAMMLARTGVGAVVAGGVSFFTGMHTAAEHRKHLVATYAPLAAKEMSLPEASVDESVLRAYAEKNPFLRQAFHAIDHESNMRAPKTVASVGAGLGATAIAGVLTGPVGWTAMGIGAVAGMAGTVLAGKAIETVDHTLSLEETGVGRLEQMAASKASGMPVTGLEVFSAFAAADPQLSAAIKEQGGRMPKGPFAQWSENDAILFQGFIARHPKMRQVFDISATYAAKVNSGEMIPQTLAGVDLGEVMAINAAPVTGGHVGRLEAERASRTGSVARA